MANFAYGSATMVTNANGVPTSYVSGTCVHNIGVVPTYVGVTVLDDGTLGLGASLAAKPTTTELTPIVFGSSGAYSGTVNIMWQARK